MRSLGLLAATATLLVFASSAPAQVVVNPMETTTPAPIPQLIPDMVDPVVPPDDTAKDKSSDADITGTVRHFPTVSVPEPGALILTGAAVIWAVGSWRRRRNGHGQETPST